MNRNSRIFFMLSFGSVVSSGEVLDPDPPDPDPEADLEGERLKPLRFFLLDLSALLSDWSLASSTAVLRGLLRASYHVVGLVGVVGDALAFAAVLDGVAIFDKRGGGSEG